MSKAGKDVVDIQAKLKADLDTLKDRVEPPSGFKISTKGKQFTLPDGSSHDGPMKAVVLDWVSENVWYEGIYNAKDPKPPSCFAIGRIPVEMAPSDNSPKKQSDKCVDCERNKWGSDPGGGKGKACKNKRRLLVAPSNATADFQPWIIDVSPTGIKHFDKYINMLADIGKHPMQIVTEISFDPNEAFPSLRFRGLEAHDDDALFWELKEKGQSILLQEPQVEKAA